MDLQLLIDQQEIVNAMNNVAICADLGQWDRLISDVFADEVTVDYTSLFGGEAQTMRVKDLVAAWRTLLPGFEATQHVLSNHQVTVSGESATALAYVRAYHYLPNRLGGDTWIVSGFYDYELVKKTQGWRIRKLKLNLQYTEGNQNLLNLAREYANPEAAPTN